MTYEMQVRIPLKYALTKMWMDLVNKRSKILKKIQWVSQKCVGVQIDSISVCVRLLAPPLLKMGGRDLIYSV